MYHYDIRILGFDINKKQNNTGKVSLLKMLINICTGNWQVKQSKIKYNIRLDKSDKVKFYFFVF